jgi:hypothetical protein
MFIISGINPAPTKAVKYEKGSIFDLGRWCYIAIATTPERALLPAGGMVHGTGVLLYVRTADNTVPHRVRQVLKAKYGQMKYFPKMSARPKI